MQIRSASMSQGRAMAARPAGAGHAVSRSARIARLAPRYAALAALGMALAAGTADAQTSDTSSEGEFSIQRFAPAPGPRNLIVTRGNRQDGHLTWSAAVMANYGYRPFVVRSCSSETDCDDPNAVNAQDINVVESVLTGDFYGSFTIIEDLQFGLRVPVTWVDGDGLTEDGNPDPEGLSAVGMGDIEIDAKYRLPLFGGTVDSPLGLGVGVQGTIPMGNLTAEGSYIGNATAAFGGRAIFDGKFGGFGFGVNLGGIWRETGRVGSTDVGAELFYSGGVSYQFSPLVAVLADAFGSTNFESTSGSHTLELLGGVRISPLRTPLAITAGAGGGLVQGVGVPSVRGFLGLMWIGEAKDQDGDKIKDDADDCPTAAEDMDGFEDADGCPETDDDDDSISDDVDQCPKEAEDADGYKDEDGCPELDNDDDKVVDDQDVCPLEPETVNGFKDDDGCPDEVPKADTDADGVPDDADKCPEEVEDTDGFADEDGCPDPDNDEDGVLDAMDECPEEKETPNKFEDTDGCPDEKPKPAWMR